MVGRSRRWPRVTLTRAGCVFATSCVARQRMRERAQLFRRCRATRRQSWLTVRPHRHPAQVGKHYIVCASDRGSRGVSEHGVLRVYELQLKIRNMRAWERFIGAFGAHNSVKGYHRYGYKS